MFMPEVTEHVGELCCEILSFWLKTRSDRVTSFFFLPNPIMDLKQTLYSGIGTLKHPSPLLDVNLS